MKGLYVPNNTLHPGRYVGPNKPMKDCTALISDNGEFWAVQADDVDTGYAFGWWKFHKEDWEIIT
jgi:hypothetical protein